MARIGIVTTFQSFNPWYSLTGIVRDQARMLTENGHKVFLFVNEQNDIADENFPGITLIRKVPFAHLFDYRGEPLTNEHWETARRFKEAMTKSILDCGIDVVFTHDILLTGWNKPYAIGLQSINDSLPGVSWLHWIHSIPSLWLDWWQLGAYGKNHHLVYPNASDAQMVAEHYRTTRERVKVIPHIKDLRVMMDFHPDTCRIIDAYPALMSADITQIYPASTDRLHTKRVDTVIKIFGHLKNMGHSVCLFVANQWSTLAKHHEDVEKYREIGRAAGLTPGKDLIFSSCMDLNAGQFHVGLPAKILMELMMLGNLFIFPTDHETFGLVLPEAVLAGSALCVLSKSLDMQAEISGHHALYFDFGSFTRGFTASSEMGYLRAVANVITNTMREHSALRTRTFMRQSYNYTSLYQRIYGPLIGALMHQTRKEPYE